MNPLGLHTIDFLVVIFFLVGVIGLGWWASRGVKEEEDFYLGASFPIDSIRLYPQNPADFPTRFTIEGSDNLQFDNPKNPGRSLGAELCAERKWRAGISGQRRNVPLYSIRHPRLIREEGFRCPANGSHVGRPEYRPDEVYPRI